MASAHEDPASDGPSDPSASKPPTRPLPAESSEATLPHIPSSPSEKPALSPTQGPDGPPPDTDRSAPEDARAPAGYAIEGEIGRGGMGVVYRARSLSLQRPCALKMILSGAHSGSDEVERFRTEAQAIARLQHPGIVQVFEIGDHDGKPFMALEYCPGGSLEQRLAKGPLQVREAAELVRSLAIAVQAAHEARVLHRDLKPANVLLTAKGEPKVTDFGLAKKLDEAGATRTGSVMGTPSYIPPEQAQGRKGIGPPADVYSLGAVLYECLGSRPPFLAATPLDTMMQVVADEPVPLRQLNHQVPVDVETIVHKCLQKEPRRRYGSARELAADLGRYLAGEPIVARPVGAVERGIKWVRRNAAVSALTAGVVLALTAGVAVSGWFAYRAGQEAVAARQAEGRAEEQKQRAEEQLSRVERLVYAGKLSLAQSAFAEGNGPLAMHYLDECQWNLRGWEHRHLWTRFNSKQTLKGHTGSVFSVAFSPDGSRILTGSGDRTAKVWDAARGTELLSLKGHTAGVLSVAFSPDGSRILTGSLDSTAKVWDAAKGQELLSLKGHTNSVYSVAFSPDGTRVFARDATGKVLAWAVADGKPADASDPPAFNPGPARSPDGKLLARPDGYNVAVVDLSKPAPESDPWPLPDAAERERYHGEQAQRAEKDRQHFAVAFHLGRLLLDDPDNADLKQRREEALKNHAASLLPPPPPKPPAP